MRSINIKFKEQELKNPFNGAFINLTKAVRGQKFSRKNLVKAFKKLMPNDEYEQSEIFELINFLEEVSNTPVEVEIEVKNTPGSALNLKDEEELVKGFNY